MKNEIFVAIFALCVGVCQAQWTPDPFCPYPSDHVTRYPYYGNCSVYWECYEGSKYVMECPEGLEFNAPLQQCDTPSIANCDPFASTTGNPNPPTYTTESTVSHLPGPDCPYPSEELIYFPYPGDCTMYWECFEGNHYLYNCPDGLWWHQEISQCDYPGDFCTNSTGTPTVTPPISTTTHNGQPDCTGTGDDPVFYPYYGDCTKYWECADGKLYIQDCPDGLWWHQEANQCDYPGAFCTNSTIPTDSTWSTPTWTPPPTTLPPPTCDGSSTDEIFYPYPGDCTKYWMCTHGDLYLYECPDGLWWDPNTSECEYPGDFCFDGTTPTTNPTTPLVECEEEGSSYLPDPNSCHLFVWCLDGSWYEEECPTGLYYDEDTQKCVPAEESDCCQNSTQC
ncbi:hypothetical protein Zmor_008426 [Zophobas morio]|nr:hypothetical protein Zmor_008426 [Zophobas morio]